MKRLAASLLLALALAPAAGAQEPGPPAEQQPTGGQPQPTGEQPPTGEPPPAPPAPPLVPYPDVEVLSRPGTLSRYAFVLRRAIARTRPSGNAKAVARLRLKTQDGTDELLMVLERSHDARGRPWLRVRLPILPNNSTGWVPEEAMGRLRRTRSWVVVDRRKLRLTLIRAGKVRFRAPIGIGQSRWPTPRGQFFVRNRLSGFNSPLYGVLAFGLNARSHVLTDWPGGGFIGIHGTNQPYLLPGRVSHGCIRMRNRDILRLDRLMPVGSPVTVR